MDQDLLKNLTVEIVSAHVGNNKVSTSEVPRLIETVYQALAAGQMPASAGNDQPQPAVPIRASVKPEQIICLECGAKLKVMKRHLAKDHGLSPADYRARWGLGADYPMIAPLSAARRREIAKKTGLGVRPAAKRAVAQSEAKAKAARTVQSGPTKANAQH